MKELGVTIGVGDNNKIEEMINATSGNDIIDRLVKRYRLRINEEKNVYLISSGYRNCIKSNKTTIFDGSTYMLPKTAF